MKKLIAIAVVLALVAGAAFAADVGVDVFGTVEVVSGSGVKDTDLGAGGSWGRTQFNASGENGDGTFGGWFRFRADGWGGNGGKAESWGNVWWKPIDQVKFMIGGNNDGLFGADGVTRWGFYQVAGDVGIANPNNAWYAHGGNETAQTEIAPWVGGITFSSMFYGGWGNAGAVITITPIDALTINIAIPFISSAGRGEDVYKKTAAQVAVNLDGIGKLAFTYDGYEADGNIGDHLGTLFTYFNLTAIENLSVDLGIGLPFIQGGKNAADKDVSYFDLALGLGVTFNAGPFGVKARFGTEFASRTEDGKTASAGVPIIFDVMPFYAVTDNLTAHLSIGLGGKGKSSYDGKENNDAKEIAWHVYPYVTVKGGWWAPNFYAGLKLEGAGDRLNPKDNGEPDPANPIITWSVPIGIAFSF